MESLTSRSGLLRSGVSRLPIDCQSSSQPSPNADAGPGVETVVEVALTTPNRDTDTEAPYRLVKASEQLHHRGESTCFHNTCRNTPPATDDNPSRSAQHVQPRTLLGR